MSPAETKLRTLVTGLDLPALEALASKGLVRRAQKDLERGVPVGIAGEETGTVRFTVGEFQVSIPEAGPAKATCSCSSTVVCQHVLTAVLYLQLEPAAPGDGNGRSPEEELLSFTREQLESWAGKGTFRAALQLAAQSPVEVSCAPGTVIQFPALNAQCHYAAGAGLDGIIVSGGGKDEKRLAVAAVIAFQRQRGVAWEMPATQAAALEESAGAPRSRAEVLDGAQQLFCELLESGLARLSSSAQQRLATLAVSAAGVNLPRLSLALRGLSSECAATIARQASSDLGRTLGSMAHSYALCAALRQSGAEPRPDLVGWFRTQYENLGTLELTGVAAWPWRTASGYTGLTLLFWDGKSKRWNSWTESRPVYQQQGFHPVARYRQASPWEGAESPQALARGTFRLTSARGNSAGRLSGSSKSRVMMTGAAKIAESGVTTHADWAQLLQVFDSRHAAGLADPNPLDAVFTVTPAAWGQRVFDPVAQIFWWPIVDSQGRRLEIEIGFDTFSEPAIRYLERADVESLEGAVVVGRVRKNPRGLALNPYSIHRRDGEIVQLFLDAVEPTSAGEAVASGEEDEGPDEERGQPQVASNSPIHSLIEELDESLLIAAEAGTASLNPQRMDRFDGIAAGADRIGLRGLAVSLRAMVALRQPSLVLRCTYLAQLYRRALGDVS